MQPAEATGNAAHLQMTDADGQQRPDSTADSRVDTTLYLRAGDADRIVRTHGALTLVLLPEVADAEQPADPFSDLQNAAWHLRLSGETAPTADLSVQGYAVTGAQLVQLDADPLYEALVSTYTGGAHCCTTFHVFDAHNGAWRRDTVSAGSFGFAVRDLDGDGAAELVGEDPRFEYAFSSFAASRGATRIFAVRGGRFRAVTTEPRFQHVLEAHRDALAADLARSGDNDDVRRGLLAALAAEYALLGDAPAGLELAAQHLPEGDRAAFLRDLRAFLAEQGFTRP